jgi:hypothetical protein
MKLQKLGGYAALGVGLLLVIMVITAIALRHSNSGIAAWNDPVKRLDAIGSASPVATFAEYVSEYVLMLFMPIAVVPFVLALRERMQTSAPNLMRAVVIAASIACALWIAYGLVGILGVPSIAEAKDYSAYRAVAALLSGLSLGGDGALGWALLLIGGAALKNKGLPRTLSYLCVIKGVIMILEFGRMGIVIAGVLLGLVIYPWLGIVLLRSTGSIETPSKSYSKA